MIADAVYRELIESYPELAGKSLTEKSSGFGIVHRMEREYNGTETFLQKCPVGG